MYCFFFFGTEVYCLNSLIMTLTVVAFRCTLLERIVHQRISELQLEIGSRKVNLGIIFFISITNMSLFELSAFGSERNERINNLSELQLENWS